MQHFTFTTKEVAARFKIKPASFLLICKNFGIGVKPSGEYRFTHKDIYRLEEILKESKGE